MLTNIDNNGVVQYSLDDGQTKINTTYRSVKELSETIEALDKIRARLHATLTGTRIVRLCDAEAVQSNYLRRR
jgi:hypothetical protein